MGEPLIVYKELFMARKTKNIDVNGMSITEIMNIDLDSFNKMNERELRAITSRLVSAGNKRIRRLTEKGITSPAIRSLGTDTSFSTKLPKGVTREQRVNALRSEFSRARNFLSSKTSTMGGYRKYVKEVKNEIAESVGVSSRKLAKVDIGKAFETLHKLQERGVIPVNATGSKGGSKGSIHARDYIIEKMMNDPNIDIDDIMSDTEQDYTDFYESEIDAYEEDEE